MARAPIFYHRITAQGTFIDAIRFDACEELLIHGILQTEQKPNFKIRRIIDLTSPNNDTVLSLARYSQYRVKRWALLASQKLLLFADLFGLHGNLCGHTSSDPPLTTFLVRPRHPS